MFRIPCFTISIFSFLKYTLSKSISHNSVFHPIQVILSTPFPNLVKLVLSTFYKDSRDEGLQTIADLHSSWPKLEFLGGEVPALRNLGWSSSTRYLDIRKVVPLYTTFTQFIQAIQPICLDVDLGQLSSWSNNNVMEGAPALLSGVFLGMAELSRLTHLILGLAFPWNRKSVKNIFVSRIPLPAKVTLTLSTRRRCQLAESFR